MLNGNTLFFIGGDLLEMKEMFCKRFKQDKNIYLLIIEEL